VCLCFGRKSKRPKRSVFNPINAIPISGKAPPYSLSMVFPKATYKNKLTSRPKTIYPVGCKYFELDINSKYNHNKLLKTIKTKLSDNIPIVNILSVSIPEKLACVIG
jgi:hypothetical protein